MSYTDGYTMSLAITRLGEWIRDVSDNTDLIFSVIDLLKRSDKLNDGTVNDRTLFINFIGDYASKICSKFSNMEIMKLARFNPYAYTKSYDVFLTPEMILSRIKLYDCFNASGDEVPDIVDNAIGSLPTFNLKEGVKDDTINKLRKIKSYISMNGPPLEDEMFQSCLVFSNKHNI